MWRDFSSFCLLHFALFWLFMGTDRQADTRMAVGHRVDGEDCLWEGEGKKEL